MPDPGPPGCCRWCFRLILASGFTALFMWLSLRASNPVCSIQDIYVPALNKTANSTDSADIYFNLKLDNQNNGKGIYYDALNLTFSYAPNTSFPVGNRTFSGFYQGHNKNTRRKDWVKTGGVPPSAVLRVNLETAVRFKIAFWKTKKHKLEVAADVQIDTSGKKVEKKGVKLKSSATTMGCYLALMGPLVCTFVVLYFV
ncbi:hypothetical protein U1Q18_024107 [Sarracenia purpurea var. burkii]